MNTTMAAQAPAYVTNLDNLTTALSKLGMNPPNPSSITSLNNTLSPLTISHLPNLHTPQENSVYTILTEVTPTSLRHVEYAIDLYALTIGFYEAQLDLDKEDPQLEVVRDLVVARKC